ncbi:peroxiredoxin [Dyella mobilis]|uniref:thioredoxin-dependent peroxiredoxin n=1 Tax=Dyella mobilis TaxID=1849582 RepID=A0ABS2KMP7_9GAMM|nr:peroxiredoxin [Dyella mobilis]MBM7132426.1 peroxiredoxin [Dyella mobilis]GLQ95586.1 peroxiredoxin [Dyella mobilis]
MRRLLLVLAVICLSVLSALPVWGGVRQGNPQIGQAAPAFRLQDQNGHWHAPADYHGHWLVLYFYPRDFTPGCTTELCSFRDSITQLRQAGADVLGVSLDDVKSHGEFAAKYHVPFPLLSDANRQVAMRYGVLTSAVGLHFAKRTTFLVDPNGKIAKIYRDVDPGKNAAQVLSDLTTLKKAST